MPQENTYHNMKEAWTLEVILAINLKVGARTESTDIFSDVFIRPLHGTLGFLRSYQSVNVKFIEHSHCVLLFG